MTTTPAPAGVEPADPAERGGTRVDGVEVLGALSPSRVGDFLNCPLLYRFRRIDKLAEAVSLDALRGTVVHGVLERLFDLPSEERTAANADRMVYPVWSELRASDAQLDNIFAEHDSQAEASESNWIASCQKVLATYFRLEDPRRFDPVARELYVETTTDSGLLLRGYVDRLDVASDGAIRLVDYKTGNAPSPGREEPALFQLKFYALVVWRMGGVAPSRLQLLYLGSGEVVSIDPEENDLLAVERKVEAVWRAIHAAERTGEWHPSRSRLCDWCSFQSICPEFGGTPPALPQGSV